MLVSMSATKESPRTLLRFLRHNPRIKTRSEPVRFVRFRNQTGLPIKSEYLTAGCGKTGILPCLCGIATNPRCMAENRGLLSLSPLLLMSPNGFIVVSWKGLEPEVLWHRNSPKQGYAQCSKRVSEECVASTKVFLHRIVSKEVPSEVGVLLISLTCSSYFEWPVTWL